MTAPLPRRRHLTHSTFPDTTFITLNLARFMMQEMNINVKAEILSSRDPEVKKEVISYRKRKLKFGYYFGWY